MKCPRCVAGGKRSRVFSEGGSVTLMAWTPYWDEDGQYHNHDPNWHTYGYRCSEGDYWQDSILVPCPAGDYPKKQE